MPMFTPDPKNGSSAFKRGGIFFFECGMARRRGHLPVVRVKELEDDEVKITLTAMPTSYPDRHLVDVHYRLVAKNKNGRTK